MNSQPIKYTITVPSPNAAGQLDNQGPSSQQVHITAQQPTDMSFYAQMDPKTPFPPIFPGQPIAGFHHSPFSLVPNPTANPLLQQDTLRVQDQLQQHQHQQQQQQAQQNANHQREAQAQNQIFYSKKSKAKTEQNEEKNANSLRDKQKIIFDATGKKIYGCALCDFSTKQKGLLKVHINGEHYKMKVFNCELCKFTTVQRGNLRAHMLTVHEKSRNFPCEFCEYRAGTKGVLKTHVKNKHLRLEGEVVKTYNCSVCPFKGLKRSHLKEHIRNEHRPPAWNNVMCYMHIKNNMWPKNVQLVVVLCYSLKSNII